MLLGDIMEEIFVDLRRRKLRTVLTVAGISIGSFTIGIMVALGIGLHNYITVQARALRSEKVLRVAISKGDFIGFVMERLSGIGRPAREIKEADKEAERLFRGDDSFKPEQIEKLKAIEGIVSVSPRIRVRADSIRLAGDGREFFVHVRARSPLDEIDLACGRMFRSDSEDEVILAYQYLESFGIESPEELVGKRVTIKVPVSRIFARLGLMPPDLPDDKAIATFDATVVGLTQKTIVSTVAFVSETFAKRMARFQRRRKELYTGEKFGSTAIVRVRSKEDVEPVKARIKELGFFPKNLEDDFATLAKIFVVIDTFLSSFGVIAFAVASLGIINTLIMSIYERTREIGIMKALGATPGNIRFIFTLEAASIGFLGGILGAAASFVMGQILNQVALLTFARDWGGYKAFLFPWWFLVGTVFLSTIIGGLAGLYPAGRAARLDPIRALRYE
jgi:ABC-type antimicrobial peptide transport system permease subunit